MIVYSNTTKPGGETVIGSRSTIGGNVWITQSIPPGTKVLLKKPDLIYSGNSVAVSERTQKDKKSHAFNRWGRIQGSCE